MVKWQDYIESNPDILFGKPVFKNTRIPVDLILEKLSNGETTEEILAAYPSLNQISIQAALAYAAATIRNDVIFSRTR